MYIYPNWTSIILGHSRQASAIFHLLQPFIYPMISVVLMLGFLLLLLLYDVEEDDVVVAFFIVCDAHPCPFVFSSACTSVSLLVLASSASFWIYFDFCSPTSSYMNEINTVSLYFIRQS